jgi:hypothetical protein
VFALLSGEEIHLTAARRKRAGVLAPDAKKDKLRDVAEVEADAAAVRAAILPNLVPDDVGFVLEAPCLHDLNAFRPAAGCEARRRDTPTGRR